MDVAAAVFEEPTDLLASAICAMNFVKAYPNHMAVLPLLHYLWVKERYSLSTGTVKSVEVLEKACESIDYCCRSSRTYHV